MKTLTKQNFKQKTDPSESLMDAVVRLTAKGGIENVSVRTIIAEAKGVSTDTYLYHLFGSKEKLMSDAFLREDKKLAVETERRSSVLWETNLPFESRMRYLWNTVWQWLTTGHIAECLFLTRYYYSSLCDGNTLKEHQEAWYPLSEKWRDIFPKADTIRLAENFFYTILTAAFPVCQGRAPNDGTAAENGFQTLLGAFAFWVKNAETLQSVNT